MTYRKLAAAIALTLGAAQPLMAAVCKPNAALPLTTSALQAYNPLTQTGHNFPDSITDSEGYALKICVDPTFCFFDPAVAGNAYSINNGFGAEGFWYLAESAFNSTNTDVLVVMGAEAAYAAEVPNPNETFPFTRLRIRVTVPEPGTYTVLHPYGYGVFDVASVVDDRGRPTKRQINATSDISFAANSTTAGNVVGPWLRKAGAPLNANFLGDGPNNPATPVVGSPCGQNFVRVTGVRPNGTPIPVNPGAANPLVLESNLFTVQGEIALGAAITPLAIDSAYFSRQGGNVDAHLFTTAPSTAIVSAVAGLKTAELASDNSGRFYASLTSISSNGVVPAPIVITATNGTISAPRVVTPTLVDLVTITKAEASCTAGTSGRVCTLTVQATSSDDLVTTMSTSVGGANHTLSNGTAVISGVTALPARITVASPSGGSASKPVSIINN